MKASTQPKAKKPAPLQNVPQPHSFMALREQSIALSDLSSIAWGQGTMEHVLEEIVKAMAPLRHLKEAALEDSDDISQPVVVGYLSLFLDQMDHILGHAEVVLRKREQGKPTAA